MVRRLAGLPLGLLLLELLAGCTLPRDEESAMPIDDYFFAAGRPESSFTANGWAYDGVGVQATPLCLEVMFHDRNGEGQVHSLSYLTPDVKLDIYLEDFNATSPSDRIVRERVANGATGLVEPAWPEVPVARGGAGTARVMINDAEYREPVTGKPEWNASFVLVRDGFRDNTTKAIQSADGRQPFDPRRPRDVRLEGADAEAHLVVHEPLGAVPGRPSLPVVEPSTETIVADQAFRQEHFFANTAFGGNATLTIEVVSDASLAFTSLNFRVLSPSGREVANVTIGPSPAPSEQRTVSFVVDELVFYEIQVSGSAVLTRYGLSVSIQRPTHAAITQWWEEVVEGRPSTRVFARCERAMGALPREPPAMVGIAKPPGIDLRVVFVGVAAIVITALLVAKIAADQIKAGEFRKKVRRR